MSTLSKAALGILVLSLGYSSMSHALTPEEAKTVQKAAVEFLGSTPESTFLIAPEAVYERIQSSAKDYVLVDVRSAKDFQAGHIPTAINIPYRDIANAQSLAKLPRDKEIILYCNSGHESTKEIILYCNSGHESTKVLSILKMLGYNAYGMKWGMMAWNVVPSTAATLKAIATGTSESYPLEK